MCPTRVRAHPVGYPIKPPVEEAELVNLSAGKITSGRFIMARLPDGTVGYFLKAAGVGIDPAYALLAAADIPALDQAKITTGRFPMARILDGTAGLVLTAQGAAVDPVYAVLPPTDIFAKYLHWFNWETLDGFSVTVTGTGVPAVHASIVSIATSVASGDLTILSNKIQWNPLVVTGKIVTAEWIIRNVASLLAQTIYLILADTLSFPPATTVHYFGFKVINADIFAVNCGGVAETSTDTLIDASTDVGFQRLKVVLNPGTDCKFYVNGVLTATHTTNLPTIAQQLFMAGIRTDEAVGKTIYLFRFLLEKEY